MKHTGNDNFTVELTTERLKGKDKNLLDLYNVKVRRTPAAASRTESDTLQGSPSKSSMPYNETNVNSVSQKNTKSVKKGSYDPDSKVIQIFKDADASTLPHELAHYWLDNIFDYVNSGKASQAYLNSYKAITDYLGKPRTALRFSKAQSEKFAAAYEKYLRSGNLPQPIFGTIFNDYDEYLKDVYKSLEDITISGTTQKPVLTPEIIKFFQSWTTANLDSNSPIIQKLHEQAALDSFVEDVEKSDKEAFYYLP